jgi:hypothetical protein
MKSLMWDYKYSPEECLEVLEGKRKTVGHYNEKTLFRKLLESYHWFTILKILDLKRISELLSDDVIQSLRMPSMRKAYQYVRKKLP